MRTPIRYRKSIRLKGYDYSLPGDYFVTICTHDKQCTLGEIINEKVQLSEIGKIAAMCWLDIPKQFQNIELDEYIIMPNHIHGIIVITEGRDLINQIPTSEIFPLMKNPKQTLGKIIRYYKARATKLIRNAHHPEFRWQNLYYDRIIRSENELNTIRHYILNNPIQWMYDKDNIE